MSEPAKREPAMSYLEKQSYSGFEPPTRPGTVTGAAVVAFVMAALQVYGAVSGFAALSSGATGSAQTGVLYFLSAMAVVFAALLLWGGLAALRGTSRKLLLVVAVLIVVVTGIDLLLVNFSAVIMLAGAAVIIVLLTRESSRAYYV